MTPEEIADIVANLHKMADEAGKMMQQWQSHVCIRVTFTDKNGDSFVASCGAEAVSSDDA